MNDYSLKSYGGSRLKKFRYLNLRELFGSVWESFLPKIQISRKKTLVRTGSLGIVTLGLCILVIDPFLPRDSHHALWVSFSFLRAWLGSSESILSLLLYLMRVMDCWHSEVANNHIGGPRSCSWLSRNMGRLGTSFAADVLWIVASSQEVCTSLNKGSQSVKSLVISFLLALLVLKNPTSASSAWCCRLVGPWVMAFHFCGRPET